MSQKYLNNFIEQRLQTFILARDYGVNFFKLTQEIVLAFYYALYDRQISDIST